MKVVLEVVEGPHRGARFEFDRPERFVVGRAPTAHVRLPDDPHFSRHHFVLHLNPPHCYLRDLGSSSGTFVNGKRFTKGYLYDGDVIAGGTSEIRFLVGTDVNESTVTYEGERGKADGGDAADEGMIWQAPAADVHEPAVPGYEIHRKLGQGGMGVVYHATQISSARDVALKLILPEAAGNEHAMRLFLREVSVLSRLQHSRIVQFYEMGIARGQLFFAMEYVPTVDLNQLLANKTDAARIQTISGVVCQVLEALQYAHSLAFVHRDIKPANILVTRNDRKLRVKIADFGLAKNFANNGLSGVTTEGHALGTCAFMAPEQILNSRDASPAADIYSVGATLYRLLSNRLPYEFLPGEEPYLVVLEKPIVPIESVFPAVPPGLAGVIQRSLSKDPSQRYPSAQAMYAALLPYAKGRPAF